MEKNSQYLDFLKSVWLENQDTIIQFGKMVLMSILVLLVAEFILATVRKIILRKATKVVIIDEAVRKIFYTIFQITIWVIASLIILDIFGFNTTGLLTVLGTIGLAIGTVIQTNGLILLTDGR